MKFSRFLKSTKGRIIVDVAIIVILTLTITLPIVMLNSSSSKSNRSFEIVTNGSTSVTSKLNELVGISEDDYGFVDQMEVLGVEVSYKGSHTGSGEAFEPSETEDVYIGFQSRELESNEIEKWGYDANVDTLMYTTWETDAIVFIYNKTSASEVQLNLSSNLIFDIYTSGSGDFMLTDLNANTYKITTAFNRDAASGSREAFENFIGFDASGGDKYSTRVKEVNTSSDMLFAVDETEFSIGYSSLMSITDGYGNVIEHENIMVSNIDGVVPTIENVQNGSYSAIRPFTMFFRVEESESDKWVNAMFDPTTGEWGDLSALSEEPVNQVGSFLFYNWILYSELAVTEILDIGGQDSAVETDNLMSVEDMGQFVVETKMFE